MYSQVARTIAAPEEQKEEIKRLTLIWVDDQEIYEGDEWNEILALLTQYHHNPEARKIEIAMKSEP